MLIMRKFTIKTSEPYSTVIGKMHRVIECEKNKDYYKGEFFKERFRIVTKRGASASAPAAWYIGEFVKTKDGTDINVKMQFDKMVRIVFYSINVILALLLWKDKGERHMVLGAFVFIWFFYFFESWLATWSFKKTIQSSFEKATK
jgi:hypothetical protein